MSAAASPPEPEAAGGFETVAAWLLATKCDMCESVLAELGYDEEIGMIIEGDDEEVQSMLAAVQGIEGVKIPTVKKFKRALAKVRGKGEEF